MTHVPTLRCCHNGRQRSIPLPEAHRLAEEVSLLYIGPLHWLGYQFGQYKDHHFLVELPIGPLPRDFLFQLMTRGRRVLTDADLNKIHNRRIPPYVIFGWATRARGCFPCVPTSDCPFVYVRLPNTQDSTFAYQMRPDITWLLLFPPQDDSMDGESIDWLSFRTAFEQRRPPPKE